VAQVRAIFQLPPHIAHYSLPLVYVEYFTELQRVEGQGSTWMYQVHRTKLADGLPEAEIIPLTRVARSCHLIPIFGDNWEYTWDPSEVLEGWKDFYLNDFFDIHAYNLL